jgi:hypothetical protein
MAAEYQDSSSKYQGTSIKAACAGLPQKTKSKKAKRQKRNNPR